MTTLTTYTSRTCNRFLYFDSQPFSGRETECVWQTAMYLECRRTLGALYNVPVVYYIIRRDEKKHVPLQDYECSSSVRVLRMTFCCCLSLCIENWIDYLLSKQIKTRNEQQPRQQHLFSCFIFTWIWFVCHFFFFVLFFRFIIVVNLHLIWFIFKNIVQTGLESFTRFGV